MVTLDTVLEVIPIVSLVVVLTYYTLTIRNQNKTRQAQLLMGLYETYRSREFRRQTTEIRRQRYINFDDWWSKYGQDSNPDAWASWMSIAAYFNGIGILLKKGLIDIELVDELLSNVVFGNYRRMEKPLMEWRKRVDRHMMSHEIFEGYEYLYDELQKRAKPLSTPGYDQNF